MGHALLTPIIEMSFDYYDKDHNQVLSQDESRLFVENYVDEQGQFFVCLEEILIREFLEHMLEMSFTHNNRSSRRLNDMAMKRIIEEQIDEKMEGIRAKVKGLVENYRAHRFELDSAVFKVLDANNDGQLQREEVVEALLPKTPKNMELLATLGVTKAELQKVGFN